MKKRKNVMQIVSLLCCLVIVIGIIVVKVKEFSANKMDNEIEQEEMGDEKGSSDVDGDTITSENNKNVKEKNTYIKDDTMNLGEENEDSGLYFTLQSVKLKEKDSKYGKTGYYVLKCYVESNRKGETVNTEKFANNFSIKTGEMEKKATLMSGKKKLTYKETANIKMVVDCGEDISKITNAYQVFYTTDPETDGNQIMSYRTEYVLEK